MEDIRPLGRMPKRYRGTKDEAKLAEPRVEQRLRHLRVYLSETQQEELASLSSVGPGAERGCLETFQ